MRRKLFRKIVENLREIDYFKFKRDDVGELGFSIIQKCTMALRMLAYGIAGDTHDDYLRMADSTTIDCIYRFYKAIVAVFGETYLRTPTETQLGYWYKIQRGIFLGCLCPLANVDHNVALVFVVFLARRQKVRDFNTHHQLQDDLVEYLWTLKGGD
jgi:hypothetical protein